MNPRWLVIITLLILAQLPDPPSVPAQTLPRYRPVEVVLTEGFAPRSGGTVVELSVPAEWAPPGAASVIERAGQPKALRP